MEPMTPAARKAKAMTLRLTAAPGDERGGGREVRRVASDGLTIRESVDGASYQLSGWASVTGHDYDMGFYRERIRPGAFAETLSQQPDVQLLINHEGLPLARTVGGSLRLAEDDRGLCVDATLDASDPDVQRLAPKVRSGLIDQMSFAFSGARSEWDDEYENREIISLNIHRGDVSVVNQGANPATSFSMRSLVDRLIEPSDEALAELRELFGPDDLQAALTTLNALVPVEEVPAGLSLDHYRARAFALRARGSSLAI